MNSLLELYIVVQVEPFDRTKIHDPLPPLSAQAYIPVLVHSHTYATHCFCGSRFSNIQRKTQSNGGVGGILLSRTKCSEYAKGKVVSPGDELEY